jgi:hypothetical protein
MPVLSDPKGLSVRDRFETLPIVAAEKFATDLPKEGPVVTPAVDCAARDRPLSDQSERLAGQRCRAPSCRCAGRYRAHRRYGQRPGQPPQEQSPADARVSLQRRSPAPGPLRRLQRQTRFQLRPAVPGRRSCLRSGQGGLTPNRAAVPRRHRSPELICASAQDLVRDLTEPGGQPAPSAD